MDGLYITGQMRSGTTLISSFIGKQKGCRILVDQLRILTASAEAFKDGVPAFDAPLTVNQRVALFRAFVNVTLWIARSHPKLREVALARIVPFTGFLREIRTADTKPHVLDRDIIDLPEFRTQLDFYDVMLDYLIPPQNRANLKVAGNKETRGEAFANAYARLGGKSILVMRDPRAVVSSLLEKIRTDQTFKVDSDADAAINLWLGSYRNFRNTPNALCLRYEDFVTDHEASVGRLSDYLGVNMIPGSGIVINNSSYGDVQEGELSRAAISRWRENADPKIVAMVNERCRTEILDLGYDL